MLQPALEKLQPARRVRERVGARSARIRRNARRAGAARAAAGRRDTRRADGDGVHVARGRGDGLAVGVVARHAVAIVGAAALVVGRVAIMGGRPPRGLVEELEEASGEL